MLMTTDDRAISPFPEATDGLPTFKYTISSSSFTVLVSLGGCTHNFTIDPL